MIPSGLFTASGNNVISFRVAHPTRNMYGSKELQAAISAFRKGRDME